MCDVNGKALCMGKNVRRQSLLQFSSGLLIYFLAAVLPHYIRMPHNIFCKWLFKSTNYAQCKKTRKKEQQPTAVGYA